MLKEDPLLIVIDEHEPYGPQSESSPGFLFFSSVASCLFISKRLLSSNIIVAEG